jgi:hypothetical protein
VLVESLSRLLLKFRLRRQRAESYPGVIEIGERVELGGSSVAFRWVFVMSARRECTFK